LKTLEWLSGDVRDRRADFLKCLTALFPDDEFKHINSILHHQTRKRSAALNLLKSAKDKKSKLSIDADVSDPVFLPAVPAVLLPGKDTSWWHGILKDDVVGIDVEFVNKPRDMTNVSTVTDNYEGGTFINFKRNDGTPVKYKTCIATVSLWVFDSNADNYVEIFNEKAKHEKQTFQVTQYTKAVNGFKATSFENGQPESIIKNRIHELIQNKLLITCGGVNDLISIGMFPGLCHTFDLQQHFKRTGKNGDLVPHKLKNLVRHFFDADFQKEVHNVSQDALQTLRLFLEIYIHLTQDLSRNSNYDVYDNIVNYK